MDDSAKLRFIFFLGFLLIFLCVEIKYAFHKKQSDRQSRWPTNLGFAVVSSLIIKALFPIGLLAAASLSAEKNWGLFQYFNISNHWLTFIFSLLILDFFIYLQHVISHKVPVLWRIHRLHHSDLDLDVTTALRFHPIEIFLSFLFKAIIIIAFGISIEAVIVFEILLNSFAMFNHTNLAILDRIEIMLRKLIVTPQMHITHHSVETTEQNKNFGFCLSIWDFIFKTHLRTPTPDTIGLNTFRKPSEQSFWSLLKQPFY